MKSLQYLKKISSNPENTLTLDSLMESLKNDNLFELIPYLSNKGNLFVNTWARNPWLDYSRSDELFACTSIGDYASSNSPSFLADLNISNLDIWSNGNRIGRIHFYLLKDHDNRPVLLVDRINGSDRLMRHKKRLNELFDCIINYSQFLGFKRIFFNSKISYNNTPKQFVNYLASKNLGRTFLYATRFIEKGGLDITLNTINNSFLEAMESKDFHLIEGFLVNIES
ncbi:MAG TPA: hypothetical protein PLS49_01915, partial [Candidatus Woesebacteria bacterium]|nr:hypothetical protein [Candidatus Woesebacteria bacterium]